MNFLDGLGTGGATRPPSSPPRPQSAKVPISGKNITIMQISIYHVLIIPTIICVGLCFSCD